jgi:hypothetical protein
MSSAAARLKACQKKLRALDRKISKVGEERLIFTVTNPLAIEHMELCLERKKVERELRDLEQHFGVTEGA